jgi:hypothetical protein
MMRGAKSEVSRIFLKTGVAITWLDCSPHSSEAERSRTCPEHPASSIVLRLVPSRLSYLNAAALGFALPTGKTGVYATVSFSRVERCVRLQTTSSANLEQILGHAIAHELGHILLGTGSHAPSGLMQPDWNAEVLRDVATGRLFFSRDQAQSIRNAVDTRLRLLSARH